MSDFRCGKIEIWSHLSMIYVVKDLEETSKKLYKEVKKYQECLACLHRQEEKVSLRTVAGV